MTKHKQRMIYLRLLPELHTTKPLKPLNHLVRLFCTTAIDDPVFSLPSPSAALLSPQQRAKAIASQLLICTNLSLVHQVHAHILCSGILHIYPVAYQWNNIIRAYTRLDSPLTALQVYLDMARFAVLPDRYTLPIVLKAAIQFHDTQIGKQLHSVAMRIGLARNEFCESGFIGLYCKAGEFGNAGKLFDENPERKLGSWNAIIGGLAQAGRASEAVDMFIKMKRSGFEPDDVTMVSATSACGGLGNLSLALQLHRCVLQARSENKPDIMMMNSLIDMYGKCGRMDLANEVFNEMPQSNVLSWTSMIVGYATHGKTKEALQCFHQMRISGVKPNCVTFIGVLSACVHGGLVEEGKEYFTMMKQDYNQEPELQHYGCMVDLLSRAGRLREAKAVVEGMPMRANAVVLGCLMGACEKFGDVEMGEWVAKHMVELEPWNDGVYVVLANVYADRGLWDEVERVRRLMKERKLAKVPAYSYATSTY